MHTPTTRSVLLQYIARFPLTTCVAAADAGPSQLCEYRGYWDPVLAYVAPFRMCCNYVLHVYRRAPAPGPTTASCSKTTRSATHRGSLCSASCTTPWRSWQPIHSQPAGRLWHASWLQCCCLTWTCGCSGCSRPRLGCVWTRASVQGYCVGGTCTAQSRCDDTLAAVAVMWLL